MDNSFQSERTHTCGELNSASAGSNVILQGWVRKRRDLGKLIFVDLADRYGITQIVFDPDHSAQTHGKARELRGEFVIELRGEVRKRPGDMMNRDMITGEIEVLADSITILNRSEPPQFPIEDKINALETTRLKYRYLDLRRPAMRKRIIKRHRIISSIRNYMDEKGFLDIETPFLTRSTPEGARDYLVPSRIEKGNFYALPQSPQIFKQILMIAGFDRYYQIVKCFRDEDLRHDRQPEFTQLDVEMSFASRESVFKLMEGLFTKVLSDIEGIKIKTPFDRLTYADSMNNYGTDKPDLRFGMEISDLSDIFTTSQFRIFKEGIKKGQTVKALALSGGAKLSRKEIEFQESFVKHHGAAGLIWIKFEKDKVSSSISKFLSNEETAGVKERMKTKDGDIAFIVCGDQTPSLKALGELRLKLAAEHDLFNKNAYAFAWITDFPLFEYSQEEKRLTSIHHPFTSPMTEDLDKLERSPQDAKAQAYDLVMNGYEIGGGSIRIHDCELQQKIFDILKIGKSEAEEKFGFLLDALKYGAPPHGGIALGLDRICMVLSHAGSIRDVIAFPKTQSAQCLLSEAPGSISPDQLKELGINISKRNE